MINSEGRTSAAKITVRIRGWGQFCSRLEAQRRGRGSLGLTNRILFKTNALAGN